MYVGMSSSKAFNTHLMPAFAHTQYYAGPGHTVRNKHSSALKDPEDNGQQNDSYNMLSKGSAGSWQQLEEAPGGSE